MMWKILSLINSFVLLFVAVVFFLHVYTGKPLDAGDVYFALGVLLIQTVRERNAA